MDIQSAAGLQIHLKGCRVRLKSIIESTHCWTYGSDPSERLEGSGLSEDAHVGSPIGPVSLEMNVGTTLWSPPTRPANWTESVSLIYWLIIS